MYKNNYYHTFKTRFESRLETMFKLHVGRVNQAYHFYIKKNSNKSSLAIHAFVIMMSCICLFLYFKNVFEKNIILF